MNPSQTPRPLASSATSQDPASCVTQISVSLQSVVGLFPRSGWLNTATPISSAHTDSDGTRATGAAAASRASVRVGLRRGARLEPGEHVVDELGRRAARGVLEHAERGRPEEAGPLEELGEG